MSDPTGNDYNDDDRHPRKRRRSSDNPFDDFLNFFQDQFGTGFNFENLFDQMDFILEDIFRRFSFRTPLDDKSGSPNFVWGFRMTMGPDGRPHIERFGNTPRKVGTSSNYSPSLEREPLIDVIEDNEVLRVIAEIPGVTKQDINLSATENSLLIQAASEDTKRKYFKELDLPCIVVPESAKAKFKNGVLEVELIKVECEERVGKKVKVD
jgi:HSP20 family protein